MLPDGTLTLTADRGVFSASGIDPGTELLMREAPMPPLHGDLLDLGAGYGPIALTLARRSPEARVWAVDVNERALDLVRDNARAADILNVVPALPDQVPSDVRFAAIYSNPPVRIGKPALRGLLEHWLDRLHPDARAYLVVQKHLGSDSLARWLVEGGFSVRRLCSRKHYRVLDVRARSGPAGLG